MQIPLESPLYNTDVDPRTEFGPVIKLLMEAPQKHRTATWDQSVSNILQCISKYFPSGQQG